MGINGHVTFKPELYSKVCRLVRNYHNVSWDARNPGDSITIPITNNHINWKTDVYGPWKQNGFTTDICLMFGKFGPDHPNPVSDWKGKEQWIFNYGRSLAAFFGPSGPEKLATSFEIGNEPGKLIDPSQYKNVFRQMAAGIRAGDPKALILTPAVQARPASDYYQDLDAIYADRDIIPLYDVINIHTYPTLPTSENTWNCSYPEDSTLQYMAAVDECITWRDHHAPQKKLWVTEFGYDACTPTAMQNRKDWALRLNWQGTTDLQQAQYLVRSFFEFATRDVDRAYIYDYDDDDVAAFHQSSGLTRKFQPKMSFWAVRQLYEILGNYRLHRIVKHEPGNLFVYEFEHCSDKSKKIWVAWSPTGAKTNQKDSYRPREATLTLNQLPGKPVHVFTMATADGPALEPKWQQPGANSITLPITESPTYIIMETQLHNPGNAFPTK